MGGNSHTQILILATNPDSYEKLHLDQEVCSIEENLKRSLHKLYFPLRTKAKFLTRISPFESFLLPEGKVWGERNFVEFQADRKKMVDSNGYVLFKKNHANHRVMSKIGHLLYKEFVKEFTLTE